MKSNSVSVNLLKLFKKLVAKMRIAKKSARELALWNNFDSTKKLEEEEE